MLTWVIALAWLFLASVAQAGTHTITLTDEEEGTLAAITAKLNMTSRSQRTPDQMLQGAVQGLVDEWARNQQRASTERPWAERTAHEKRLTCRMQKLDPCPK